MTQPIEAEAATRPGHTEEIARSRRPAIRALAVVVVGLLVVSTVALAGGAGDEPEPTQARDGEASTSELDARALVPVAQRRARRPARRARGRSRAARRGRPGRRGRVARRRGRSRNARRRSPPRRPAAPRSSPGPSYTGPAPGAGVASYGGLGTWVDVFDWSNTFTGGRPAISHDHVDHMAARGVQILYIQASRFNAPGDGPLEPDRLRAFIDRAHARGIAVVAWYLPNFVDVDRDLRRLLAIARLPVESVAVDIEARDVADVSERNRRLVWLSSSLRNALPGRALGAIVLPPVATDVINPNLWPSFPWHQLRPHYDVWLPMSYWTNRAQGSAYRNAHRYTTENVNRLRANLGMPDARVHPIGGIGDRTTPGDVAEFRQAAAETSSLGGSLYDWRTTGGGLWPGLQGFRR